jgi:hypothetical protein
LYKEIMMPWILFLFSYMLYNTYSVILTRIWNIIRKVNALPLTSATQNLGVLADWKISFSL